MEKEYIIQRLAGLVVGAALITVGIFMVILGLTLLPVIGVLVAIPIMSFSLYFLFPKMQVYRAETGEVVFAYEEHETWCPWPPVMYRRQSA